MAFWFNPTLYHLVLISVFIATFTANIICGATNDDRKVHVVYMGSLPDADYSPSSHHEKILQDVLDNSSSVSDSLVRSYKRSLNGFAAMLTDAERDRLAKRSDVVSVFPSRTLRPQTTRSWDFMGFTEKSVPGPSVGSDVIIGIIDSGIWPDSESFSGLGFPPPPPKWKGACIGGKNFFCNNKLIGARYYNRHDNSALDTYGHGTHVASTAAGNSIPDASFFGVAQGTARGGAPSARIAMYKACLNKHCEDADILAAFDDAISDGVDIISVSLATAKPVEFIHSGIAIGAFHAMAKNILTVQSAGNSGNRRSSVSSNAPWIFTVAASNTDRRIIDKVVLSNGMTFVGSSVNSFSPSGPLPLISGRQASSNCSSKQSELCSPGCLDSTLVKGKIVVCNSKSIEAMYEALTAGALGAIVPHTANTDSSTVVPFPASSLCKEDFLSVMDYLNSNKDPQAIILKSEGMKVGSPPQVASFSSRGPNAIIPDILKPDISAPGVDIVAAFSIFAPLTDLPIGDTRTSKYSVLSGTSMACPHTTGVAAYVKSLHPDWTASAIKSAIMTTAWLMKDSDYEFAFGAGHINPVLAADPGLVYEITLDGYLQLLCGIKFNQSSLLTLYGNNNISCPIDQRGSSPRDLNYPSMTALVERNDLFNVQFTRVVTNVGSPTSVYNSRVSINSSMEISVIPNTLAFTSVGEKQQFTVTVSGTLKFNSVLSASVIWSDGTHNVTTPVVVHRNDVVGLGVYVRLNFFLQIIGVVLLL